MSPAPLETAFYLPGKVQNVYELHQQVWSLLSPHPKNAGVPRGYLYRVNAVGQHSLVLARIDPTWAPHLHGHVTYQAKPCPIREEGQQLRLRVDIATLTGTDGRDTVPANISEWLSWLMARHGLAIRDLHLQPYRKLPHCKPGLQRAFVPLRDCSFAATVTDVGAAQQAWLKGVGRKRAYGAGMLLGAPV